MANLTFRVANPTAPTNTTTKNSPLTNNEIDGNFKSLEDAKFEKSGGTITGAVTVTGDVSATNFNSTSDARLKTDLQEVESALDKIKALTGYTFVFNNEPTKRRAGVIAQEVMGQAPEVVTVGDDKYLAVNYDGLIAYLIEAIKELDQKIEQLKVR